MSTLEARKYPKRLPKPTQRKGAQSWEIRVRVPPEARGGQFKGTHTTRSLRTRDKAEACRSLPKVYDELQAEFEAEAARLAGGPDQGDHQTPAADDLPVLSIDEVCRIDRQRTMDSEECFRREVLSGFVDAAPLAKLAAAYDPVALADRYRKRLWDTLKRYEAEWVIGDFRTGEWLLTYLEKSEKGRVADRDAALKALARARVQTIRDILADDDCTFPTDLSDGSSADAPLGRSEPEPVAPQDPPFSEFAGRYIEGRGADFSDERRQLFEAVVRDFIEIAGDKPPRAYTKRDGGQFIEVLRFLPANWMKTRQLRGLAVCNAADKAKRLKLKPQAPKTLTKKIAILKSIFAAAAEECTDEVSIAFPTKSLPKAAPANAQRREFNETELDLLLTSNLGDPLHWLTWLGLCTGARLNELAQLTRGDVKQHGSVHYLTFTPAMRFKSVPCERAVPLHSKLIEQGFLEFVATRQDRLFPGLTQHSSGRYSDALSKKFSRHLRNIGLKGAGLSFHSLRHTFTHKFKVAAPRDVETRERLLGHAVEGVAGRYGKSYAAEAADMQLLEERARAVERIKF